MSENLFRIEKLVVGKGKSVPTEGEVWSKTYYQIEMDTSACQNSSEVALVKDLAEKMLDEWLQNSELTPGSKAEQFDFNPEELMQHNWKNKKKPDGGYTKGSLSWGWDFQDQFSQNVIAALSKGPVTIDQYEFSLQGNLVQTKKVN